MESVGLIEQYSASFWSDRPVLVTGSTGLLGSWLTRALIERGAVVVALIRDWVPQSELIRTCTLDRVRSVRGDVRDQETVERALGEYEIDTAFHLAAQTIVGIANRNPLSTFESNIRGSWTVLEACRRSPAVRQVIVASSDKAYGAHEKLPYLEDAPLQGRHPYDVSKSCADLIAQSYWATYGLPVCVTRCGNLYGGGDLNWNRIVPGTIRSALHSERPIIRSDGTCVRDYFYVEDAALAYLMLAEQLAARPELAGQAFNFSNESQLSVLAIARLILGLMGCEDLEPEVRGKAPNEIGHQFLDASKARKVLGWRARFSLEDGLSQTIDWYTQFLVAANEPSALPALS
jgi:CDP-glucose 4,6-dehydratase